MPFLYAQSMEQLTTNLQSFNDLVYTENLDMILTETWLKDSISNNEKLPKG